MALGWVRSEGIAVDEHGRAARPHDPLVRHPAGGRHAADRGRDRADAAASPSTERRSVRRSGGRASGSTRVARRTGRTGGSPTMTNPADWPYTPAVRAGDWLVVSGQVGSRARPSYPGGVEAAAAPDAREPAGPAGRARRNARPGDQDDGVPGRSRATTRQMNDIYGEAFPDHRPARSAFAVAAPPPRRPSGDRGLGLARVLTVSGCGPARFLSRIWFVDDRSRDKNRGALVLVTTFGSWTDRSRDKNLGAATAVEYRRRPCPTGNDGAVAGADRHRRHPRGRHSGRRADGLSARRRGLGYVLMDEAERSHAGSELIELNK